MSIDAAFLDDLKQELGGHRGVCHPFLDKASGQPYSLDAWFAFSQQSYPHLHFKLAYLEALLRNTPPLSCKIAEAGALLSEYMNAVAQDSEEQQFRLFARACNGDDADATLLSTPLDPASILLVEGHMRLCAESSFLRGLGALGPAHDYARAAIYPLLVEALKISGFQERDIRFFIAQTEGRSEQATRLQEAILTLAWSEDEREKIREGALLSLELRDGFWSAIDQRMTAMDSGRALGPTGKTLAQLAEAHAYVPSSFWADAGPTVH